MALFKYFKPSKPSETVSTDENPSLNEREKDSVVDELRKVEENKGKRSKYRAWTPAQRAEIGKHAANHGNATAIKLLGLKRQTVSDFKSAYTKLKKNKGAEDRDITKITKKKTGRPTLLPENLMKKVIETVANLRLRGAPVSAAVIRAVASAVASHCYWKMVVTSTSVLIGHAKFCIFLINLVKKCMARKATTAKILLAPALPNKTKLNFQRKINKAKFSKENKGTSSVA